MSIPNQNKIIILFLAPENKIWSMIAKKRHVELQAIKAIANVSNASLHGWAKGERIKPKSGDRIFDTVRGYVEKQQYASGVAEHLRSVIEAVREAFYIEGTRVDDVTRLLSMSISQGQQIIDTAIYKIRPLFSTLYAEREGPDRQRLQHRFEAIEGTYQFWMQRGNFWLQCALRVRYLLQINGGLAIRCKLNVPMIHANPDLPPHWQYDGFVGDRSSTAFWMFEKRLQERGDYLYFISDFGKMFQDRLCMTGTYLTTGQDPAQSTVTGTMVMRRISNLEVSAMENAMETLPRILSGAQTAEIEDLLRNLRHESFWAGLRLRLRIDHSQLLIVPIRCAGRSGLALWVGSGQPLLA